MNSEIWGREFSGAWPHPSVIYKDIKTVPKESALGSRGALPPGRDRAGGAREEQPVAQAPGEGPFCLDPRVVLHCRQPPG